LKNSMVIFLSPWDIAENPVQPINTKVALKLFGERNTGTTYLKKLIEQNLEVNLVRGVAPDWVRRVQSRLRLQEFLIDRYFDLTYGSNLGWKHSKVDDANSLCNHSLVRQGAALVSITKNPYSWLLSLHRRPYHQYYPRKLSFEEFLSTSWTTVARDRLPGSIRNPVELWNIKNASYLPISAKAGGLNLTYEKLIEDPGICIENICEKFSLTKIGNEFENIVSSTKESDKDASYYRDYYLGEEWRYQLSETAIDLINRNLNHDLATHYGYEILGSR
jgi:hypothetical protein